MHEHLPVSPNESEGIGENFTGEKFLHPVLHNVIPNLEELNEDQIPPNFVAGKFSDQSLPNHNPNLQEFNAKKEEKVNRRKYKIVDLDGEVLVGEALARDLALGPEISAIIQDVVGTEPYAPHTEEDARRANAFFDAVFKAFDIKFNPNHLSFVVTHLIKGRTETFLHSLNKVMAVDGVIANKKML